MVGEEGGRQMDCLSVVCRTDSNSYDVYALGGGSHFNGPGRFEWVSWHVAGRFPTRGPRCGSPRRLHRVTDIFLCAHRLVHCEVLWRRWGEGFTGGTLKGKRESPWLPTCG